MLACLTLVPALVATGQTSHQFLLVSVFDIDEELLCFAAPQSRCMPPEVGDGNLAVLALDPVEVRRHRSNLRTPRRYVVSAEHGVDRWGLVCRTAVGPACSCSRKLPVVERPSHRTRASSNGLEPTTAETAAHVSGTVSPDRLLSLAPLPHSGPGTRQRPDRRSPLLRRPAGPSPKKPKLQCRT